jgi:hypothetical protein
MTSPEHGFVRVTKTSHYLEVRPWWKNFLESLGFTTMTETVTYDVPVDDIRKAKEL